MPRFPNILLHPCHLPSNPHVNMELVMWHLYFDLNIDLWGYIVKTEFLTLLSPVPTYDTTAHSGSCLNQVSRDYLWFLSFPCPPLCKLSTSVINFSFETYPRCMYLSLALLSAPWTKPMKLPSNFLTISSCNLYSSYTTVSIIKTVEIN